MTRSFLAILFYLCGTTVIAQNPASMLLQQHPALYPVVYKGKVGYIDNEGEMRIKPTFESGQLFYGAYAKVTVKGKVGYINTSGNLVIKAKHGEGSGNHGDSLFRVEKNMGKKAPKYGYMKLDGKWLVPPKYAEARDFSQEMAAVRVGEMWGFINTKGKMVIKPQYQDVGSFSEGRAYVKVEDKYGYIDLKGKMVIEPRYSTVGSFREGVAGVEEGLGYGFIDENGTWVLMPDIGHAGDSPPYYTGGYAVIKNEKGKYGVINKEGTWLIQPRITESAEFREGFFPCKMGGMWGCVNKNGKVSLAFDKKYEGIGPFINGIAQVKLDGSWNNYMDRAGKLIWGESGLIDSRVNTKNRALNLSKCPRRL